MARRVLHHDERTHLFVGTSKGVFVYDGDFNRDKWKRIDHQLADYPVSSIAFDYRDEKTVLVASSGGGLLRTLDFGRTWDKVGGGLPSQDVTCVAIGNQAETGTIWAGLRPAGLARSTDGGETFEVVDGLAGVASRSEWKDPAGVPCVHSIVVHPLAPDTLHLVVSGAGVFRSTDGGASFAACNTGLPAKVPAGAQHQDVHREIFRMVSNPAKPERFYVAARGGIFRTEDGGESWQDMTEGLSSSVVRSIVVSPSKPGTVFVVPMVESSAGAVVDGDLAVYRSTLGGEMWDRLEEGLEDEQTRATIHREAMHIDDLDEEGLYFGTSAGSVYASLDDGDTWSLIVRGLGPILALEVVAPTE